MSGASRYTRAISAEVGEIERRLRAIERTLETISGRASTSAQETAGNLGETIGSAFPIGPVASAKARVQLEINQPRLAKMRPNMAPRR